MKKQQFQPLTPAALYARVSSDRQDVDLSWPPNCGRSGSTPRKTATWWPGSTGTRPRAAESPTGPSSGR